MDPFFSDFLANSLATGLGAVIGIPIALWIASILDWRQERERKTKMLSLLIEELQHNACTLSQWQVTPSKSDDTGILHARLKDQLWRAFSDGGELQWVKDPLMLSVLSHAYHLLAAASYLSAKHFEATQLSASPTSFIEPAPLLIALDDVASSFSDSVGSAREVIDRSLAQGAPAAQSQSPIGPSGSPTTR